MCCGAQEVVEESIEPFLQLKKKVSQCAYNAAKEMQLIWKHPNCSFNSLQI